MTLRLHLCITLPVPLWTPWGKADLQAEVFHCRAGRVWEVSTPDHGGLMISQPLACRLLSPRGYQIGEEWEEWLCLEEDVAWAVFAYEYPDIFSAYFRRSNPPTIHVRPQMGSPIFWREYARRLLQWCYPEYFETDGQRAGFTSTYLAEARVERRCA